ncbi:MAG: hypothetical protein IPK93_08585 [Solirubrobacterales bacterium]|nr:hypothetical protein [Solirubrobacterales bacterium]
MQSGSANRKIAVTPYMESSRSKVTAFRKTFSGTESWILSSSSSRAARKSEPKAVVRRTEAIDLWSALVAICAHRGRGSVSSWLESSGLVGGTVVG